MLRVLLVADSKDDFDLIKRELKYASRDIELSWVESPAKAFQALKRRKFDCILSGYRMPGKNGLEFLRELRDQGSTTPFIFLTAQGNERIAAEALRAGADDHYTRDAEFAHFVRLANSITRVVETQRKRAEHEQAELALRDSLNRHKTVADTVNDIMFSIDLAGNCTYVNRAGEAITGYSHEELLGMNIDEIVAHKKDLHLLRGEMEKALKGKRVLGRYAYQISTKRGKLRDVEINMSIQRDQSGRTAGFIGTARDVTERKRAEEALRESEEKYRNLVVRANDLIAIIQDGVIKFANPRMEDLLGYRVEETIGTPISNYILPEDLPKLRENYERRMAGEEVPSVYEAVLMHKDGRRVHVEINAGIITYEGRSADLALVRDITERKRIEEELQESEGRFRALTESTSDWIWEVDVNGVYTYASPRIKDLLGYEPDEVIGKTPFDLMPPEEAARTEAAFRETTRFEKPIVRLENINLHKDGREIVLETSGVPVFDSAGRLRSYRGIDRDITERRQAEEKMRNQRDQLEKVAYQLSVANQELEAFCYSVSHDLQAPLRHIEGFSKILLEDYVDTIDKEGKKYLRNVSASSRHMKQLISDLLKLSRLTSSELTRETVDLSAAARSIAKRLRSIDPGRQVDFIIPRRVLANGDKRLLRLALENLIGNAWKFSSRKRKKAIIEFGTNQLDGQKTYFVRDNGTGFEMSKAKNLFVPFRRLHKKKEYAGSGIGLATVRRIINRHGGRVWAKGRKGKGATFFFTLE